MTETSFEASDCLYCLGRRGDPTSSVEHIWPSSLGGRASPSIFRTDRVCGKCNNLAGLFVDGPFRKNWFVQNEGWAGHQFLDPSTPNATALVYLGFERDFPLRESEVCERWIGPAGEHIYHIHERDDARWETFAGGDIIRRKTSDGGRAYILMTSQSQYWAATGLLSLSAWFPYAKKRCLTRLEGDSDISGIGILTIDEVPISADEKREIAYICARPEGHQVHIQMPIQIDFADRFMAKVALGLADTILGNQAALSPYSDDLRTALWEKTAEGRKGLSLRGTGFWTEPNERFAQFAGCSGAWTILLNANPDTFSYTAISPSGKILTMAISDDPRLWPENIGDVYGIGVIYIAIPERNRWFGPIPLPDFISHNLGSTIDPALAEIELLRTTAQSLPLKR